MNAFPRERAHRRSVYPPFGIDDRAAGARTMTAWRPTSSRFQRTERVGRGAALTPLAFPDVALTVADIVG
jgi:hypothetical protein